MIYFFFHFFYSFAWFSACKNDFLTFLLTFLHVMCRLVSLCLLTAKRSAPCSMRTMAWAMLFWNKELHLKLFKYTKMKKSNLYYRSLLIKAWLNKPWGRNVEIWKARTLVKHKVKVSHPTLKGNICCKQLYLVKVCVTTLKKNRPWKPSGLRRYLKFK